MEKHPKVNLLARSDRNTPFDFAVSSYEFVGANVYEPT
jgi:hypothetical protein